MSEAALYRRYRPHSFDDVVGQDHVVEAIKGAVANSTFAHAYLFAGGRGTGKTSIARIFAESIGVQSNDLYEIDAASNRGIDDVRELRESVSSLPMESPYKLYIIDEVHMLTKEAFNALLKTLEEPPAHALFVLATTEVDKLPDTVISRCQHFTFSKPSHQVLCDEARRIAKQEGCDLEDGAADIIALHGEGSFRDMLGVLQKVMTAAQEKTVTEDAVAQLTGAPRQQTVNDLVKAIGYQDTSEALSLIYQTNDVDGRTLSALILKKIRLVLLLRFSADLADDIKQDVSGDEFDLLSQYANDGSFVVTSKTVDVLLEAYEQTKRAIDQRLPLELAVVRLSRTDE